MAHLQVSGNIRLEIIEDFRHSRYWGIWDQRFSKDTQIVKGRTLVKQEPSQSENAVPITLHLVETKWELAEVEKGTDDV